MVSSYRSGGGSAGSIETRVLGPTTIGTRRFATESPVLNEALVTWSGACNLPGPLPDKRRLTMRRLTRADGESYYLPTTDDGYYGYASRAFQLGHATLARDRKWDRATYLRYLLAKVVFDRAATTQDRLRSNFSSAHDFRLRPSARVDGRDNVLPEDFGRTADGRIRIRLGQLVSIGGQAASAIELVRPAPAERIARGLTEAALLNPLRVKDDEIGPLFRMALFDVSKLPDPIDEAQTAEVRRRFGELMRNHLDERREIFVRWLGGSGNLVKAIANYGGTKAGRLDREVVKRGLLDWSWEAFGLVGECIEAFARSFAKALPRPLSAGERRYYEAMYYRRPYLGGLPLVLVMDRSPLLKPIVTRLWETPEDPRLIGGLHRVLSYYAEAAPAVRAGWRTQRSPARTVCEVENDSEDFDATDVCGDDGRGFFEELLEQEGVRCAHCSVRPIARLMKRVIRNGVQPIKLEAICLEHGSIGEFKFTKKTVAEAAVRFAKLRMRPRILDRRPRPGAKDPK